MCILKKGVPFYWDEEKQRSFDVVKKSLASTPLLSPPYYNRYFLLYLETTESSIGMVFIQEDDDLQDHVIYYLSHSFLGLELKYSHVEKMTLAAFHVVQWLQHYIMLRQTTVIVDVNPFQYVLTQQIIGGRYNN